MSKRSLKLVLKVTLVGGLLYILAEKGFLSFEATRKALGEIRTIIPAILGLLVATFLGLVRWQILLRARGIELPFRRTAELGFVGLFFNIALPGAVSGDVVKAVYVGREAPGKRAAALGSILFDRVAGSSALILVSALGIVLAMGDPWAHVLLRSIRAIVIPMSLGILSFYVYLFYLNVDRDPLLRFFRRLEVRFPKFASVVRIYEGIKRYGEEKAVVLKVLAVSFLIHLMVTGAFLLFTKAFGETQVPSIAVFIVVPLALLVTAIPVLPGGVGTGHAAFLALFALIGSKRGADIFNIFVLYQFFIGAVGGLVFLRFRGSSLASDMSDVPELHDSSSATLSGASSQGT